MSDSDDDYMSAAVLGALEDVRPGLVHGNKKRQMDLDQKKKAKDRENKERYKPKKVLEEEKREAGLTKALDAENKGFQMMAKMGFKAGMALGKEGEGRKEPVPIEVKTSREGLGRDADRKRKQKMQIEQLLKRRKTNMASMTADYRQRMRDKFTGRKTAGELRESQNVCMQLDMEAGWTEPLSKWYWPDNWWNSKAEEADEDAEDGLKPEKKEGQAKTEEEEEEEEWWEEGDDLEPSEKLQMINEHLRSTYFYCRWCGTQYDDEDALEESCPGPNEEDHG